MRLIDADALQAKCEKNHLNFVPIEFLKFAHTVDAVPVVRCKDCVRGITYSDEKYCNGEFHSMDFFCADGEVEKDD